MYIILKYGVLWFRSHEYLLGLRFLLAIITIIIFEFIWPHFRFVLWCEERYKLATGIERIDPDSVEKEQMSQHPHCLKSRLLWFFDKSAILELKTFILKPSLEARVGCFPFSFIDLAEKKSPCVLHITPGFLTLLFYFISSLFYFLF